MRINFYLAHFIYLIIFIGYSCKKTKEEAVSNPGVPPPSDTTKPVVAPILTASRSTFEVGNDAGYTDTLSIQSNIEWNLSLSAGADAWLSTEVVNTLLTRKIVKITVTTTNTSASRTATLTISPKDANISPLQITIAQRTYSLVWQKCYGGSSSDDFMETIQLTNGQLVTNGFSSSTDGDAAGNSGYQMPWIFRLSNDGNKIWQKKVGSNYGGSFYSIVEVADGGTVSAGNVGTSSRLADVQVTRTDANGNVVWNKIYGGSNYDYAYKIINTADDGYLVSGVTYSQDGNIKASHGSVDLWVIKLDANGNLVWEKTFGGADAELYGVVTACSDGGYLLCGMTKSNNSGDVPANHGDGDILVIKMDANGNKIWSKTFGGSSGELPYSVIGDPDGGCIFTGYTGSKDGDVIGNHGGFDDMWVVKLDKTGQLKWQATLGGSGSDQGKDLMRLSNGNYMIIGSTESNDGNVTSNHGLSDTWVVELNNKGQVLWQKTFGSTGYDWPASVLATLDGAILVTVYTNGNDGDVSGNHGGFDGWLFKLK